VNFAVALKRFLPSPAPTEVAVADEDGRAPDIADAEGGAVAEYPLGLRFRAWWDGISVEEVLAADARCAAEAAQGEAPPEMAEILDLLPAAAEAEFDPFAWTAERIEINEMLFGDGEILPGGVASTIDLIGSFGLGQDTNVLQIGAGLGGPARAIALEYQGWVTGYEASPELAAAAMAANRVNAEVKDSGSGMKKSKAKVKLADKARIHQADLETLTVKTNVYDCAFARETMHHVADKARLLAVIHAGLKDHGALMISDYFIAEGKSAGAWAQAWGAAGDEQVSPWTLAEAKAMLEKAGFDIRVIKDITAETRSDILRSFGGFVLSHKKGGIPARLIQPLLYLTEHWARRVALIDAGVLNVHKLQAFKIGGGP
jgi:SAM-dependent methyltransferase